MKHKICIATVALGFAFSPVWGQSLWQADNGDGTFTNPLLWGDYPDPDVCRVGDTYYMVSTSMHYVPGCPILSSKDLVNWHPVGYAVERYEEDPRYDMQGGTLYLNGSWAASIRHHKGKYYVAFCTPYGWGTKTGHFSVCEAERPEGPWKRTVFPEYLYDPGLFFDDDGRVYVAHGQGTIKLTELEADVRSVKPGTEKVIWKGGFKDDRTLGGGFGMEGSHMYKINGMYYILCPAGGTGGWQVCLRSDKIDGPYEHRIVMDDDRSYPGNGLHQGGMVQTKNGDWWFIIMQDRGAIGRVPCLVPVTWKDGWPMLGADGLDAIVYDKPAGCKGHVALPMTSDEFDTRRLGLQWQWNHNPDNRTWSLEKHRGYMRLGAHRADDLKNARNTLTQRVLGPLSTATVEMDIAGLKNSCTAGFGVFEFPYAYVGVTQKNDGRRIVMCNDGQEVASEPLAASVRTVWIRIFTSDHDFTASFFYSLDGHHFKPFGNKLKMGLGLPWTANRFALFNFATEAEGVGGYADFNWFRMAGSGK